MNSQADKTGNRLKVGDPVTHKSRPDVGVGIIVKVFSSGRVAAEFPGDVFTGIPPESLRKRQLHEDMTWHDERSTVMNIEKLIQKFEEFDTEQLSEYKNLLSTKNNGEIFPPYIPHIGSNYSKYNLMMYGMAQSIDKPWDALINKSRYEKVKQLHDAIDYNNIWIAPYKVMLAVAGVFLYVKHNLEMYSFSDIHDSIAATNYYKFSFSDNGNDVNPDTDLKNHQSPDLYWEENDKLSIFELNELKPSVVLSLNGRHNDVIKKQGFNFVKINDPSWILQGGSGVLKQDGSWFKEIDNNTLHHLIDSYLNQIDDKYAGKKEAIKIYLMKYYSDWKDT